MNLYTVDALNRPLPEEVPAPRENRLVGMFYFLWLGECGRHAPYNVSEILAADPQAGYKPDSPVWGKKGVYHHWGEPFYGYYYSTDEWVVRRHMKLLTQAGVDFLFFDTTNNSIYARNAKIVMKVLHEYNQRGLKAPKVMFYTNTKSGRRVQQIYNAIYKKGLYPDTWFCYEGRPVIIAKPEECSAECRSFFNIKLAQWPNEPDKDGGWPWMDFTKPQRLFNNLKGEPEAINVSIAQHPQIHFGDSAMYGETGNCGRSYHNGKEDIHEGSFLQGYNFAEQFDRALEADAPITLITGWNEWIAGRWEGTPERPINFVDCANYEYSRDIEMMRGGYFDNYYLQLCGYIRRLKGMEPARVYAAGETAEQQGYGDGSKKRNHAGSGTVYKNYTGRYSLEKAALRHTENELIVTVTTDLAIRTEPRYTGGAFLRLYLACGKKAVWGYDYVVCPGVDGSCTVYKAENGMQPGETVAQGICEIAENTLTLRIPLTALGVEGDAFRIGWKVADAKVEITCAEDLYDKGDCLPFGRADAVYLGRQ